MRWFVLFLFIPMGLAHARHPPLSSSAEIIAKSAVFESLSEFHSLGLDKPTRQFVNSLESEEFGDLKPFLQLQGFLPLGEILAGGVVSYSRKTYRSPHFIWKQGYDLVTYDIETKSEGTISVFAFRDSGPTPVGEKDSRPVHLCVLAENNGQIAVVAKYIDGQAQPVEEGREELQCNLQRLHYVLENATPMT